MDSRAFRLDLNALPFDLNVEQVQVIASDEEGNGQVVVAPPNPGNELESPFDLNLEPMLMEVGEVVAGTGIHEEDVKEGDELVADDREGHGSDGGSGGEQDAVIVDDEGQASGGEQDAFIADEGQGQVGGISHSMNSDAAIEQQNKRQWVTNDQRMTIYAALLARSSNGKLRRNTTHEVASLFSVSLKTVQRIWKRANNAQGVDVDVTHKKSKNCGRKRIQVDLSQVSDIPLSKRTNLRSLSEAMHISLPTLHRIFKRGQLHRHSSSLKPLLREENKN